MSNVASNNSEAANKNSNAKQEEAIKQAVKDLKEDMKKKRPIRQFKLTIPSTVHLGRLAAQTYCELQNPLVKKTREFWIDEVVYSEDLRECTLTLGPQEPEEKYTAERKSTSGTDNAKAITVNASVTVKKAQTLGAKYKKSTGKATADALYKALKSRGTEGFRYCFHMEGTRDFSESRFKYYYSKRCGNCYFFSWLFYWAMDGAGYKTNVMHGQVRSSGYNGGHFWNRYGGKYYDLTISRPSGYSGVSVVR